jgi:hypothetical protein
VLTEANIRAVFGVDVLRVETGACAMLFPLAAASASV